VGDAARPLEVCVGQSMTLAVEQGARTAERLTPWYGVWIVPVDRDGQHEAGRWRRATNVDGDAVVVWMWEIEAIADAHRCRRESAGGAWGGGNWGVVPRIEVREFPCGRVVFEA
jgi:hypothetical protein